MHKPQAMVQEFAREIVHAPTSPARPELRDARLRARLIMEEAFETAVGLVGSYTADHVLEETRDEFFAKHLTHIKPDLTEAVDGLCDLIYVAYGTAEAIGIDLEPFFNLVHAANMAKEDRAVDAHGKRGGKPTGWVDPKLAIAKYLRVLALETK